MVMGYHSTRSFASPLPSKLTDPWILRHNKRMCLCHRAPSGPPEDSEFFNSWSSWQTTFTILEVAMDTSSYTSVRCKCSVCAHGNTIAWLYDGQDASSMGPDALLYYPATRRLAGTGSAQERWQVKIGSLGRLLGFCGQVIASFRDSPGVYGRVLHGADCELGPSEPLLYPPRPGWVRASHEHPPNDYWRLGESRASSGENCHLVVDFDGGDWMGSRRGILSCSKFPQADVAIGVVDICELC